MLKCQVCGNHEFVFNPVLWSDLIRKWQLSPHEVAYIDRQQGQCCTSCGCNLRSIAIAKAIVDVYGFSGTLREFVRSKSATGLKVLEINEAGQLSPILKMLPGHQLAAYPAYDMMDLNSQDGTWDMILHSDTLEHVKDPVRALAECRRILKKNGKCIFTIPVVVDRLSRSRVGLSDSFHGFPGDNDKNYLVHTEFGMDFWKYVLQAGFEKCSIHVLNYPAAFAIEASA